MESHEGMKLYHIYEKLLHQLELGPVKTIELNWLFIDYAKFSLTNDNNQIFLADVRWIVKLELLDLQFRQAIVWILISLFWAEQFYKPEERITSETRTVFGYGDDIVMCCVCV